MARISLLPRVRCLRSLISANTPRRIFPWRPSTRFFPSIAMDQVPANRGYPGDLYSQLASRYEKACDYAQGGSVTILTVTTMPGDDVTHPVPDNTGYIYAIALVDGTLRRY